MSPREWAFPPRHHPKRGFEEPAFTQSWSYARAQRATEALFEKLGTRDPAQLRLADSSAVKQASHDLCGIPPPPGQTRTPADLIWMPVVDGHNVIANDVPGWPVEVPLLLGCVENEARYFIRPNLPYPPDTLEKMSHALCGQHSKHVLDLLRSQPEVSDYECMDKLMTTLVWTEPALQSLRKFNALAAAFTTTTSIGARLAPLPRTSSPNIPQISGTCLAILLSTAVMDTTIRTDEILSEAMQEAWLSFARDGIPRSSCPGGGLEWPRYDPSGPTTTLIGDEGVEVRPFPMTELISFVNSLRLSR